jgi:serine/threonine protein kinase
VIDRQQVRGGCAFRISGAIDETFNGMRLVDESDGTVVIDLDEVHRITSYGVREWLKCLSQLRAPEYFFVKCRPAFVSQLNMVQNFGARGTLLSFYAPYVCPSCAKTFELLVDVRQRYEKLKGLELPDSACPSCHEMAEFDDVPESYLAFLARAPPPKPPPIVDAILDGTAEPPTVPFRAVKDFDVDLTVIWLGGNLSRAGQLRRVGEGLEGKTLLVLNELGTATAEGMTALLELLGSRDTSLFLGRIRPELARALPRPLPQPGPIAVSSVLAVQCRRCGTAAEAEADPEQVRMLTAGQLPDMKCQVCDGELQPLTSAADLSALAALPLRKAPEDVRMYLAAHPKPPGKENTPTPTGMATENTPSASTFGKYNILRPIGAGGMAEVFLAKQQGLGGFEKRVVLKRILPSLSADKQFVSMLLKEARLAARISHPDVIQIFDVGQVGEQFFIAMEYVRGWDLNEVLRLCMRLDQQMPVGIATFIMAHVAAGLHAAHTCTDDQGHSLGIIHRDVSPHNVLISKDGQVKLTDFGIAKASDDSSRTPTATLKGKLTYMSPEQVRAGTSIDHRSDIFSAGLIFFQCLTLERLFRRETEYGTLRAILYDPIPRMSARRPEDAPAALDDILDKALARDREQRYASAADMHAELELFLNHLPEGPPSAKTLATWLNSLYERGTAMGQVPPEKIFTPTNQAGLNFDSRERPVEPTSPTLSTASKKGTPTD